LTIYKKGDCNGIAGQTAYFLTVEKLTITTEKNLEFGDIRFPVTVTGKYSG
jgi:hypothetical protein